MALNDIAGRFAASADMRTSWSQTRLYAIVTHYALTALTALIAYCWFYPIFGSFLDSVRTPDGEWSVEGYVHAILSTGMGPWYLNSIVTSAGVTLVVLAVGASCGYAISQLHFPGRRLFWYAVLASFFVPMQALIVSHFLLMNQFELLNTWLGVILPQTIAPLAIIVYKQFFDALPHELREAAVLDAASEFTMLRRLYLPASSAVSAGLAIITFIGAWNSFLWPFLAVTHEVKMNIAVALDQVSGNGLAGAFVASLPVMIVYMFLNRRITSAATLAGSIKG